jgi:Right handed beta helix region
MSPMRLIVFCSCLICAAMSGCLRPATASPAENDREVACHSTAAGCILQRSGPIVAARGGQVIEGLYIDAVDEPAIVVRHLSNVTIRNVKISHRGAHGILCDNAPGLTIENVSIVHSGTRTDSAEEDNISCYFSDDLRIRNARLRGGSAGVYVLESDRVHLSYLEGYDFRGPDPRGQMVQFDKSPHCTLEEFSAINDPAVAWTADNISIYFSDGCVVSRGLLVGNNGPWSVAVMFENSKHGLVEDVDTIAQGNGSFGAYPGANVTFRRTRARENICGDQGRGPPVSNALVWSGSPESTALRIEDSAYFALCNPDNLVWDESRFEIIQIAEQDFVPRPAIKLEFPWERNGLPRSSPDRHRDR